jgi:type I restriction enzyme S subunit
MVGACGLKRLPKPYIAEYSIPLPPLPEQERIVSILDAEFAKIDAVKAGAEKSLQHAKDLFQAALKKELTPKEGWETKKLGEVCTITSSKRIFKNEYVESGVPFYRTKEVKEIANNRPLSLELFISEERYAEIKEKYGVPQINDMLVSAVGTIGEIMIVKDDTPFYFKDGNLVWLKGIRDVTPYYLKYFLNSVIDNIKSLTIGAAYSALTIEKFQEMKISHSSIDEQEQIVARLDTLNTHCKTLQANYERTIALCDDMKQALLRKAFNGEL